jgi:hypothetical protein
MLDAFRCFPFRHSSFIRYTGSKDLVEPPLNTPNSSITVWRNSAEQGRRQIDAVPFAAHALIDDSAGLNTAIGALDAHGTTAVWVAIGLGTHQCVWKGDVVVGVVDQGAAGTISCSR